ncbi:hypothetical protein Sm713_65150 [Streptomyces sp. TS71-3]|nr:hypothetical protein Sm713_65150 [Streptomyces sp. TS71-3]
MRYGTVAGIRPSEGQVPGGAGAKARQARGGRREAEAAGTRRTQEDRAAGDAANAGASKAPCAHGTARLPREPAVFLARKSAG